MQHCGVSTQLMCENTTGIIVAKENVLSAAARCSIPADETPKQQREMAASDGSQRVNLLLTHLHRHP